MWRNISKFSLAAMMAVSALLLTGTSAVAQVPVIYYRPPTVTYVPEVRGLFGQRLVYRPVVTPAAPVVAAVAAPLPVFAAPPAAVTSYYAPSPVTTYYAPSPAPVTTYYAPSPAPVTTYYAPSPAPVTTYYAPAPAAPVASNPAGVTTYYAPAASGSGVAPRVTTYYAPAPVVATPVITYYRPLILP